MGLQADLGFRYSGSNAVQRGLQHVASSSLGGKVFPPIMFRIDRPLHRWSNGRLTAPGVIIGLPVVMLTTTGAKSGLLRTMPVAAIPFEDDLLVLGTNFGQATTPAWAANLAKEPRAEVSWRGVTVPVIAVRVPAERMDAAWQAAARVYAGFPKYRERIGSSREVLAFRLQSRRP